MLGPSHRLTAAVAYAGWATWQHESPTSLAIGALIATATSAGWASPDMDQTKPFEWARTVLGPAGKLLAHRRGLTHWWALPVASWMWWLPLLGPSNRWAATALLIGWASHLAGDAIFGRVCLTPGWGPMFGLRLHTSGWVEEGHPRWFPISPLRTLLVVALGYLAWLSVVSPV